MTKLIIEVHFHHVLISHQFLIGKYSVMPTVIYAYIIIDDVLHLCVSGVPELKAVWNTDVTDAECNVNCDGGV